MRLGELEEILAGEAGVSLQTLRKLVRLLVVDGLDADWDGFYRAVLRVKARELEELGVVRG